MNKMVHKYFLISVISISSFGGCNLLGPKEDTPNGTSAMSAKIQGVPQTFSSINAIGYIGYRNSGISNGYTVRINLGDGMVGNHKWGSHSNLMGLDSSASLNWLPALSNIGGFKITSHNTDLKHIEGSFNFAVIDSTRDTVKVEDGSFSFYYVLKD